MRAVHIVGCCDSAAGPKAVESEAIGSLKEGGEQKA